MEVLTDTEMPHRCTDVPPKRPQDMGCTDVPLGPMTLGTYGIGEHTGVQGDMEGHMDVWGCMDVSGMQMPPMLTTPHMPASM